jgi:hypothetical protein
MIPVPSGVQVWLATGRAINSRVSRALLHLRLHRPPVELPGKLNALGCGGLLNTT